MTRKYLAPQNTTVALAIPTQKSSHSIAKTKQNVRIVYIQTQEVMLIEPANFRKIVQSLTGKLAGTTTELKKPDFVKSTTSAPAVRKRPSSKSTMKPKVQIVHIQTPEVVEIEPIDFKNFVQGLTGKSSGTIIELQKPDILSKEGPIIFCDESSYKETEILNGYQFSLDCKDKRITGEEEVSSWENPGDGSLIGIEELDKFINELIDYPLFP